MNNRLFDDNEDFEGEEVTQMGFANGIGQYFSNPIGFGKDIRPPLRLPLKVVYDARGNGIDVRFYTILNGITYQLQPISKKATLHLATNLYYTLGAKHYEQD